MKWAGPLFLGSTLVLTLSSGTLIKRDNTGNRVSGGDGPMNQQSAGGVRNSSASSSSGPGSSGLPPGPGGTNPTTGAPLTGPGGTAGEGANREWRGDVNTDVEALRAQLPPQAKHLAESFISAGQEYGIDPLFLMSISRLETSDSSRGTGGWLNNAFNNGNAMGISNASGPTAQSSHHASIMTMAASLSGAPGTSGYYNNAQTVGQVGAIYAPVGASNDPNGTNGGWGATVGQIYDSYANSIRR